MEERSKKICQWLWYGGWELFTGRRRVEERLDGWPEAFGIFGSLIDGFNIECCAWLVYQLVRTDEHANLRPISVTSILSRLLEKVIIQRFLWPGLCEEGCLEDQFGFPTYTGSITAALIDITNFIYSKFNEGSYYVRCQSSMSRDMFV